MGLDENLPSFHFTDPKDPSYKPTSIPYLLTRGGGDPTPAYTLQHPSPTSPQSQNCYAAALFDAYSPEILYGEVLIRPRWTQPSLSQEEIRRNGGIPPPPEPILPTEFTVQLYNPDLQIEVRREQSTFSGTRYDFGVSQDTFRMPSSSSLDRSQHDPAASSTTPKINFAFKRDSKLSKDMVLVMTGRSTDVVHKKKSKEPDISIALFKGLRELTLYEPNLLRVDMEDPKGLEVAILLISTVIKDVYYGSLRQAFNVTDESARRRSSASNTLRRSSDPRKEPRTGDARKQSANSQPAMSGALPAGASALYSHPTSSPQQHRPNEPITDPRTQWQIDAETTRLRQQAESERQAAEQRRREKERRDEAERKRLLAQTQAEEKDRRRREKEVAKETERLKRIYGDQGSLSVPSQSSRPQSGRAGAATVPVAQGPFIRPQKSTGNLISKPALNNGRYPSHPRQARPSEAGRPTSTQFAPPPRPSQPQQQSQSGLSSLFPQSGGGAFGAGQSVANLLGVGGGKNGLSKKRSSFW